MKFTPRRGTIQIVRTDDQPVPLGMNIRLEFAEPMDPDEPNSKERATAFLEDIVVPSDDWSKLEGTALDTPVVEDFTECSFYYYGYHNPIILNRISFDRVHGAAVFVTMNVVVDFTYEGLGRFGQPDFEWQAELQLLAPSD